MLQNNFPEIRFAINEQSSIPKYMQIVNFIINEISNNNLTIGQKIPSINELSEECYLSRDTVEKAYKKLKERKIIISVRSKGYYIARTNLISKINVFFLINKLSSYKMMIYNAFVNDLGMNVHTNLFIYHCNESLFLSLLEKGLGAYDYYVIMPHFKNEQLKHVMYTDKVIDIIEKIPKEKLIVLDKVFPQIKGKYANIYQDYKNDIYDALNLAADKLAKYKKIILVYPKSSNYPYPIQIVHGFRMFCVKHGFQFDIIDTIYDDMDLNALECFIVIEEGDLVNLVRQVRMKNKTLGRDIGIVSYNDTPLKDLLEITVITTDFKAMGSTAAQMILDKKQDNIKNPFNLIDRKSI